MRRHHLLLLALALLVVACSDDGGDKAADGSAAATSASASTAAAKTAAPTTAAAEPAHIRGTAYTFNTPDPIAGATIKAEELPDVSAVTGADGSYDLEVPAGSTVTLYIEAAGHHTIHVQTFTLDAEHDGTELDGVNFQTPNDAIYEALKSLIAGYTGKDPFEGGCVIVTTVGDARMVGMSFDEFINFHPHGVAGATAVIEPALATAIYFNDSVIPDQTQTTTSGDGGVLWPNVPAGTYTLSATHPTVQFTTANVRCEDGWVVNANPVWGLHAIP